MNDKKKYYITGSSEFVNIDKILDELPREVEGILHLLARNMSHLGFIKTKNNRTITSMKDMYDLIGITQRSYHRKIKPYFEKYNIICKINIDKKNYFVINPFFITKNRKISEFQFIAFNRFYKDFLTEQDYYYLVSKFGINPE